MVSQTILMAREHTAPPSETQCWRNDHRECSIGLVAKVRKEKEQPVLSTAAVDKTVQNARGWREKIAVCWNFS
jgi:hypothetical protein